MSGLSTNLPANRKGLPPDAIDGRSGKPKRVPRKVRHAIRLILSGEVTTVKAAAERAGLSREHLSKSLGMPHIEAFIASESRKTIAHGKMRASARLLELIDASSEHVSLDASKHVLAIEGIRPPDQGQVNVNVGVSVGYVIDLSGGQGKPVIDVDGA